MLNLAIITWLIIIDNKKEANSPKSLSEGMASWFCEKTKPITSKKLSTKSQANQRVGDIIAVSIIFVFLAFLVLLKVIMYYYSGS